SNSMVQWNGSPLATSRISATQVTAVVPSNLLTSTGAASIAVSIKVTTPGAFDSNVTVLNIVAAYAIPLPLTTGAAIVNAASGMPGVAPGSLISIYGVNLAAGN